MDLSLDSILHYSSLPLRLIGIIGINSLITSLCYIVLIIIQKYYFDINLPGFATTVILIIFFGGLNLFSIGIIEEYLYSIIKEQQKVNLIDLIKKLYLK
jgi:hypothetical protein